MQPQQLQPQQPPSTPSPQPRQHPACLSTCNCCRTSGPGRCCSRRLCSIRCRLPSAIAQNRHIPISLGARHRRRSRTPHQVALRTSPHHRSGTNSRWLRLFPRADGSRLKLRLHSESIGALIPHAQLAFTPLRQALKLSRRI